MIVYSPLRLVTIMRSLTYFCHGSSGSEYLATHSANALPLDVPLRLGVSSLGVVLPLILATRNTPQLVWTGIGHKGRIYQNLAKSLSVLHRFELILHRGGTFAMAAGETNLRQRVGYFNANNGIFLQQNNNALSLIIRTYTGGSASDAREVAQSSWNGDKLDGSGASGITIDVSKTQIFFIDLEWLGVGTVRCGFVIDGEYIVAHTFNNANSLSSVYMQTAILPVRYEIKATGALASSKTLKQICSTVISEGGYEQKSALTWARQTVPTTGVGTSFVPLTSIRLKSASLGAVVIPNGFTFMPTSASDYFEVALIRNATLTGASYSSLSTNVEYDIAATTMTGGEIVKSDFTSSGVLSGNTINDPSTYNFDLQLGSTIGGTSDVFTLAVRTITGTGEGIGALSYWDLTDP